MGAVSFSIDHKLLAFLKEVLPLDVFVETGTFRGDAVKLAKKYFKEIYSVEFSKEYFNQVKQNYKDDPTVRILYGASQLMLPDIFSNVSERSVLYWLDAHWCVANSTAGELSQCPLIEELKAIKTLNEDSIILIDDARLFLSSPLAPHEVSQWPAFDEVLANLFRISQSHAVMVLNDNIIFYPRKIAAGILNFASLNGIDWLSVLDKSRDYDVLLAQLIEKEKMINSLDYICKQKENENVRLSYILRNTVEKMSDQNLNQNQNISFPSISSIFLIDNWRIILRKFKRFMQTCRIFIRNRLGPKLGVFYLHRPRILYIPDRYYKNVSIKNYPKISLVTPSFNQGGFIERTIQSVTNQKYPNLEFIVKDGDSRDETVSILEKYNNVLTYWESTKDEGQSDAINIGFSHASGEIMAYLNSDDILLPGTLNYVAAYFEKHPEVDVVYGHRILIDSNDNEIGRWILPKHCNAVLQWADYIPQETLFWRRELWNKVGARIDKNFKFAMDWDLILRFREVGAKFVRLPRFLAGFRVHQNQKSTVDIGINGIKEMERLRTRCHGRQVSYEEINSKIRFYLIRHIICHKLYRLGLLKY